MGSEMCIRDSGYSTEDILDAFFETNKVTMTKTKISLELVPGRLRGETFGFDLKDGKNVIVETGRRINAKHVRAMEKAGLTKLEVPEEYLIGKVLGHDLIDKETGEAHEEMRANTEITEENLPILLEIRPCLLYTSPSPRDLSTSRMPSSA